MNGDFVREKIELAGYQLFEIANNMGISQQDLQSKLKSKDVKVSFIQKVAKAMNKTVYFFFDGTKENLSQKKPINTFFEKDNETDVAKESIFFQESKNDFSKVMNKLKYAEKVSLTDKGAPYYDLPVSAGVVDELLQGSELPTGFISMPGVNCDAYFPITGCSFEPHIEAGDIIGINFIQKWENLDPDCIYLIITYDQRMLKRLINHPTDSTKLLCISPNYREFEIDKFTIRYIHKVTFKGKLI